MAEGTEEGKTGIRVRRQLGLLSEKETVETVLQHTFARKQFESPSEVCSQRGNIKCKLKARTRVAREQPYRVQCTGSLLDSEHHVAQDPVRTRVGGPRGKTSGCCQRKSVLQVF